MRVQSLIVFANRDCTPIMFLNYKMNYYRLIILLLYDFSPALTMFFCPAKFMNKFFIYIATYFIVIYNTFVLIIMFK